MSGVSVVYINGQRYHAAWDIDEPTSIMDELKCQPHVLPKEEIRVRDKRTRLLALNNFGREHQPNPMSSLKRNKHRKNRKK